MWAMLRQYRRNDANDPPGEPDDRPELPGGWIPIIYGGLWDSRELEYVAGAEPTPEDIVELPCFADAVPVLTSPTRGKMRTMVLAGPGTGKTRILTTASVLDMLELPHKDTGQFAATGDRVTVMWDDVMGVVQEHAPQWILRKEEGKRRRLHTINGHRWIFVAAKEPSKRMGSPGQGLSLARAKVDESQNFLDRAQMDIDERGRRAGVEYHVLESATNLGLPHFTQRIATKYTNNPVREVIRLNPYNNVFVRMDYWERFKGDYSERDWKQRMMAEDVPPEHLVHGAFNMLESIRPRPRDEYLDVTREITAEKFGERYNRPQGWPWIVGTDPGKLCTVSIWLKAFRSLKNGRLDWWACRETTSGSGSNSGDHGRKLTTVCHPADFIVYCDPGINSKDTDKSDYELMRREGITVVPAHWEPIRRPHRRNMFNALLRDTNGERHFFIDCDENRTPACPGLITALLSFQWPESGVDPEEGRKNGYQDPTHWPAATQFGMFPHEQIRGQTTYELVTGYAASDDHSIEAKAARYRERRGH